MDWLAEPNLCPGLFYGTPAQDGFLIRFRTPGGWLNHQQGRAIVTFAEQWGSAAIQLTNRANLQIRSVHTAPTSEVFQTLQDLGLAARNPSVDHLRNLMTSPTAGIDPQEVIDTRPLIQALDAYIQGHPELALLPAKFSIGVDGGGTVGIGTRSTIPWEHRYNEIQLSAVVVNDSLAKTLHERTVPTGIYFRLALGADKQLCDTQVLIEPDECLAVVAALVTVYMDYVNVLTAGTAPLRFPPDNRLLEVSSKRAVDCVNSHSQTAKKPRMKHLLQDWGMENYLQQVACHLGRPLRQVAGCPMPPPTRRYGHLGIHSQRQPGFSYIGVGIRLGQLTAAQLRGLVQLSESGSSQLRFTPWQTVLLPDIPNEGIRDLCQSLSSLGLSAEAANRVDSAIVACTGKPGCAAAATQTQSHASALVDHLNQRSTRLLPVNVLTADKVGREPPDNRLLEATSKRAVDCVNIHLTACAKFCAQPSPAEITLLGTTLEQHGETVEGYRVYVGDGKQSLKEQLCEVTFVEMPSLIEQLLQVYQQHRETPDESFGEFTSRYAIAQIKSQVASSSS